MKRPVPASGLGHLRVVLDEKFYMGPGRADLMAGIEKTGSISAAGKAMGMSYKRAWSLVQALNDGFGAPLVETSRGGAGQGGASLTEAGREVLAWYRSMQEKAETAIAEDLAAIRRLRSDMSNRT